MSDNNNGVDLSTGKINLPITLATITGPNGFNESIGIAYSTLGLLSQIKNWNQDAPTGLCGLGWMMNVPYIARLGNGSINDQFFLNSIPLLLKAKTKNANGDYLLEFETSVHSMTQISYDSSNETWTVVDTDGVTYIYGGNKEAIEWGIRWVSQDGQSPKVWIDSSLETDNQQQYALIWNLSYKKSLYDQCINYQYHKVSQTVGANSTGNPYDMASYLVGVQVENGASLKLIYEEKEAWEYPSLRVQYNNDGTTTNPYQDRIATQYLSNLCIYDSTGVLQQNIVLGYGFLYDNLGTAITSSPNYPLINKRILTSINTFTPDGIEYAPAQAFDYWGYQEGDGFSSILGATGVSLLQLTDKLLAPTDPFTDPNTKQTYQPLFGHLKNIQSPTGAVTWYSYSEVSANYNTVWNDGSWDQNWPNLLKSARINPPDDKNVDSAWHKAKPYWGPDGYVVIRWESTTDKKIYLQVYEWVSGQWVAAQFEAEANLCFNVTKFEDEYAIISIGVGKFGLVRTDYTPGSKEGSITLFNRDPYIPGNWNLTYYSPSQTISSGQNKWTDPLPAYTAQLGLGDNTAAVLDKINGQLYLYSLSPDGSWQQYGTKPITIPSSNSSTQISSLCVTPEEIFVVYSDTNILNTSKETGFYYWLYYYDPIAGISSNIEQQPWTEGTLFDGWSDSSFKSRWINKITLTQGTGFLLLAAELGVNTGKGASTYIDRSIAISWDDERTQVNLQKINIYVSDTQSPSWGVSGDGGWLTNKITAPDEIASTSNLINQTWKQNAAFPINKQVLRFTGSNDKDAAGNVGWNLNYSMQNLENNSDSWVIMATIDTTVATFEPSNANTAVSNIPSTQNNTTLSTLPSSDADSSYTYSYQLYQYDPIQGWLPQTAVKMGQNTDWVKVIDTVNKVIMYIGIISMVAGPFLAPFSTEALAAEALTDMVLKIVEGYNSFVGPEAMLTNYIVSKIESAILRNLLSGRRDGITESNNYLIVGTKETNELNAYYKAWNGSSYEWTSLGPVQVKLPAISSGTKLSENFSEDTYFYCGNFAIFGYEYSYFMTSFGQATSFNLHTDQVIFFRNGLVQTTRSMPLATLPGPSKEQVPYRNTNSSDHPYLMAAPWGAILGYAPQTTWSIGNIFRQGEINNAHFLALFKVQNENFTGQVSDYVVNQVTQNDGFQCYNTFYQYMPTDAYLQKGDSSILYNCVKVAAGGSSYSDSAQQYGWTESYFYTPKPFYDPTTEGNGLLYDPANAQDAAYLANNQDQTNVTSYFKMMIGKPYCQRVLKSQSAKDNTTGYEVSRQYTFYQAYQTNLIDYTTGDSIGIQKTIGVVPSLVIGLVAPDNTQAADINTAYTAQQAVLSMQYAFYDMDGLRSPWSPNTYSANSPNDLMNFSITQGGKSVSLNSALPYASLAISYDVSAASGSSTMTPCTKGRYQQNLTSLYISTLGPADYGNFINSNLFTTLQSNTWTNENLSFKNDSNNNPIITAAQFWQQTVSWELISSQASTWKSITTQGSTTPSWYPASNYMWQGTGTQQTDFLNFDWTSASTGDGTVAGWIQSGASTLVENGISLAATNMIGTPSAVIYNNNQTAPIASFTNSNLVNTPAFYLGFESYEDLSALTFYQDATQTDLSTVLSNSYSNTGNRSVLYTTQTSEIRYSWAKPFDVSTLSSGLWMASINYLLVGNDTKSTAPKFEIRAGNTTNLNPSSASVLASTSLSVLESWSTGQIIFDLNDAIKNAQLSDSTLSIIFYVDIPANYPNTIYIDNICFAPVQSANFAISTYDSANKQAVTSAIPADYSFANRTVYNNRGQAIASLRKQGQNQASTISLTGSYLSPNNTIPNTQFVMSTSGTAMNDGQNYTAGYYFDFRDGQNVWGSGTLQNRLLLLSSSKGSATYPITDNVTNIGIRAQLQGWVEQTQTTLATGKTAVGLPVVASDAKLWGAFTTNPSTKSPEDLYAYNISANGKNLSPQSSVSISSTQPVLTVDNKLFVMNQLQHKLFGVFKGFDSDDDNYYLFNFLNNGNKQIYCSKTELYPPILSLGRNVYFADINNAIYYVDVSNINNQTTFNNNPPTLVKYNDILSKSNCNCNTAPAANSLGTSIAFSITQSSSNYLTRYDIFTECFVPPVSIPNALNSSPAVADNGMVFTVDTGHQLRAYDVNLNQINKVSLVHTTVGNIVTGNGVVAVAYASGGLGLFDLELNSIGQIPMEKGTNAISSPVIHGNKISVVGKTKNNQLVVYTYNTAGNLACAPYLSNASKNLSIQALSQELSDLILIEDNTTFTRLNYGVPSASLAIGDYVVSWDATQKQYSLTGTSATVTPVTVKEPASGDWLLTIVNNTLYFYADGQQIFAEAISSLPAQGSNYTITAADNALAVRDIILINNPTMAMSYYDGTGKLRQTQTLAEILPPQTSAGTKTATSTQVCVLVQEQLYDALGRNAINTVAAAKGSGAVSQNAFAFESGFITDRSGANAAFSGSALAGQIQSWVDTRNFNQTDDTQYAYTGQYFETDPSSRLLQSSAPGVVFNKASDHSPTFCNGWMPTVPQTQFTSSLGLSAGQLNSQYRLSAQAVSLGTIGTRTQASVSTLSGRQIGAISVDASQSANFIMQTSVGSVGAGTQSGSPTMALGMTFLPNVYDTQHHIQSAASYVITQKSDALGNMIYRQSPDAGITQYYYDNAGRVRFSQNADQTTKNGGGIVNYYCYDALNRIVEMGFFNSAWDTATFATYCTNLSNTQLPVGVKVTALRTFTYDQGTGNSAPTVLGRLGSVSNFNTQEISGTVSVNTQSQVQNAYTYNSQGQITAVTLSITPPKGELTNYTTQYLYNCLNQVVNITYSDTFTVTYSYYMQGTIASVGTTQDSTYYASYQYDVNGRVINESLADGALLTQRQYENSLGQLTQLSTSITSSSTPLFTETLSYTDNKSAYQDGNIQSATYSYGTPVSAKTANYSYQYQYDIFGRLLSASASNTASGTPVAIPAWSMGSSSIDANGNIQSVTQGGTKITYGYLAGTNQINTRSDTTGNYTYTANGLTQKTPAGQAFIYDQLTMLPVQVQNTSFVYDNSGERVYKQIGENSCTYVRGTSAWPLVEIDQDQHSLHYIYGPLGLICLNDPQNQQDYFILKDHLSSSRVVYANKTNKVVAYYTYLPYGQIAEQGEGDEGAISLRYLYTGQEWDTDINLYNYHARQYDPTIGRFLTLDPAHQLPSPYVYVANNPVNKVDPTGQIISTPIENFSRILSHEGVRFLRENNLYRNNPAVDFRLTYAGEIIQQMVNSDVIHTFDNTAHFNEHMRNIIRERFIESIHVIGSFQRIEATNPSFPGYERLDFKINLNEHSSEIANAFYNGEYGMRGAYHEDPYTGKDFDQKFLRQLSSLIHVTPEIAPFLENPNVVQEGKIYISTKITAYDVDHVTVDAYGETYQGRDLYWRDITHREPNDKHNGDAQTIFSRRFTISTAWNNGGHVIPDLKIFDKPIRHRGEELFYLSQT